MGEKMGRWVRAVLPLAVSLAAPAGCRRAAKVEPTPCVGPLAPAVMTIELGESVEARAIRMHVFGRGGPVTLIFAGIHGDEPTSEYVALRLVDYLLAHREPCAARRIAVLPSANPDGLARGTRANANGVDCNRNFPARNWRAAAPRGRRRHGLAPGSEPETRAILKAIAMLEPVRILSIHSARSIAPCNNFDGPARPLAEAMSRHNGYAVKASIGYPTPGSFGTWAGVERKIPTVTLELPHNRTGPNVWPKNRDAILAFIHFAPGR